jgi:hypothetical protein
MRLGRERTGRHPHERRLMPTLLGWEYCDPGPAPLPVSLDHVPTSNDPAELVRLHEQWRQQVLRDLAAAEAQHQKTVAHHLVATDSEQVSVFGGTPSDHRQFLRVIIAGFHRQGLGRIRVIDLSGNEVDAGLNNPKMPYAVRRDVVSSTGSSFDVFGVVGERELPAFVADVLRDESDRASQRSVQRRAQSLKEVAALLQGEVTVDRLDAAVRAVCTGAADPTLATAEQRALADHRANIRGTLTATLLDELRFDLESLARFGHERSQQPTRTGNVAQKMPLVRVFRASGTGGPADQETERDILGHVAARILDDPKARGSATIIAGADRLREEAATAILDAAAKNRVPLVLIFETCEGPAHQAVRSRASSTFVFMRLPHPDDARFAAELLGRRFTFVIDGYSLNESSTEEWSESTGTSRTSSVTTSLTKGSAHTPGHWLPSMNRSRTTARTIGDTISQNLTQGGSATRGSSTTWSRTHDYVIEPDVFLHLAEGFMFVVERDVVTLAEFDPGLNRLPTTEHI